MSPRVSAVAAMLCQLVGGPPGAADLEVPEPTLRGDNPGASAAPGHRPYPSRSPPGKIPKIFGKPAAGSASGKEQARNESYQMGQSIPGTRIALILNLSRIRRRPRRAPAAPDAARMPAGSADPFMTTRRRKIEATGSEIPRIEASKASLLGAAGKVLIMSPMRPCLARRDRRAKAEARTAAPPPAASSAALARWPRSFALATIAGAVGGAFATMGMIPTDGRVCDDRARAGECRAGG